MDVKEYIESGILELYIAGALSDEENLAVYDMIQKHPELLTEIEAIEKTISTLSSSVAPKEIEASFKNLLIRMLQEKETPTKVIPLTTPKNNWMTYSGWAASLIIGGTLLFSVLNNSSLNEALEVSYNEKQQFEIQLNETTNKLESNEELLASIRDKNIIVIPLKGQAVAPDAYAKVYWNSEEQQIFVDMKGLPDPPEGKVYQLWSLKLNPLTPTSLGTVDDFMVNSNKIFKVNNPNESQAFGITLEPKGGSKSPSLDQLYTLGAIG